jgi:hypothetical protein
LIYGYNKNRERKIIFLFIQFNSKTIYMSRTTWITVIMVFVLVAGGWWYFSQSSAPATSETGLPIAQGSINTGTQSAAIAMQSPETLSKSDIQAGAANFNGQIKQALVSEEDAPKEALFQQYGTRTFIAFQKHPELISALKVLNPNFDPNGIGTSFLSSIATFNGRTLLILEGCFRQNCGGTEQLVALEPSTNAVYLLQPTNIGPTTSPSGQFNLYGKPDSAIRAAMFYTYYSVK